jgi:hypothetical protein
MSTKRQLGIEITATNKTAAAFASMERSMTSVNRSLNQMKAVAAGIGLGNIFQNFLSEIVRVNVASGEGKIAADKLSAAFNQFALNVGQAGLTQGLSNFADAVSSSNREMNSLSQIMGRMLNGTLSGLANAIPQVTAEVNDLAAAFGLAADKGGKLAELSSMLNNLVKQYGPFSENAQDGFFGLFGNTGKGSLPPGTLDKALGNGGSPFAAAKKDVDILLSSIDKFGTKVDAAVKPLMKPIIPPNTIDDIYGAGEALKGFSNQLQQTSGFASNLTGSLTSGIASSLTDIAFNAKSAGQAFDGLKSAAINALEDISKKLMEKSLVLLIQSLFGGIGGGGMGGGGFLGGLLGSFGGFYANGGTLGAGKWGIAGEAGPEIIHGPARVTPMERAGGGVKVNIINQAGAKVTTESQRAPDGSINIRALIQDEVVDTLGGGRAARVMGGRYGARIMPRRT